VTAAVKRLLRSILDPLLRWFSGQLDELRQRLDLLVDGQSELTRFNRQAVQERDAGLDVVSRAVAVQSATLESLRAEQARLADEVRALREELATAAAQADPAAAQPDPAGPGGTSSDDGG
jgi:septal ring factor EnvC (AmiA/AmiB activator)